MLILNTNVFFPFRNIAVIQNYINLGNNVNIYDKSGASLLYRCILRNFDELAIKLIKHEAIIHLSKKSPFELAIRLKKEEILKAMITTKIEITRPNEYFKLLVEAKKSNIK